MKKVLIASIIMVLVIVSFSSCLTISNTDEPKMPEGIYECTKDNGATIQYDFKDDDIVIQKMYTSDGTLVSTSKAEYMITKNQDGTYLFQTVSTANGYVVNHEMEIFNDYLLIDGEKYYKQ